jgi:hypothetical protein
MAPIMRRLVRVLIAIVLVLVLGIALLLVFARHKLPSTTAGPEAEAQAQKMVQAVDVDAWNRTGAVRWRMLGHSYLWDKNRNLARVDFGKHRVLLDVGQKSGRAYRDGTEVTDERKQKLIDKAYAYFINDMFWLNPVPKAFDDGTSRSAGVVDGKRALLVSYASGGLTPGDKYLWILDENARPTAWRVYVHIVPIPGLEFSWENWQRLSTGASVATLHKALGLSAIKLEDVAGAATLAELEPNDPFSAMR